MFKIVPGENGTLYHNLTVLQIELKHTSIVSGYKIYISTKWFKPMYVVFCNTPLLHHHPVFGECHAAQGATE
jgi:hypothetical protein